ncbi:DNA-binding protein [Pararhodospirillum oryzae]|uniref:DNA-binding protein n=2 Tax=Pararhodospirillum oryzae TaxID=478448 RepID=A0A512H6U6_9PROT|nr:DNA-binding protein [Pararhodospirillum oryzae]
MYEFTLRFSLSNADEDPSVHLDALFEAGCDDAAVGVGKRGAVALAFAREAGSAEEAVRSALRQVREALPHACFIEVSPDLVNLADVADLLGCSRQNIRKYASGEIKTVTAPFPEPILGGATSYWRLYDVLSWLGKHTPWRPPSGMTELSLVAARINLEHQLDQLKVASG